MSSDAKPAYDHADLLLFQIVHDVRALLRKGQIRAEILRGHIESVLDEKGQALFEEIFSAQRDLDQLMIRLAAYAEAGRTASVECIKLDVAILGVKLQLKARMEEAGAQIVASGTEGVCAPAAIQTVLSELVANSIRFKDPVRPLTIAVSASQLTDVSGNRREIRVSDNGKGWNPAHSERMFEPLLKLEACPEGFGLGLAIARRVVQGFGGSIRAEPGPAGGTFFIVIPDGEPPDAL